MDTLYGPEPSLKGFTVPLQELVADCKVEFCGKMLQGKYLTITSCVSPVKLYCCYGVITVLTVAVVVLSVALLGLWAFLKRYARASDHWIGLHRESPEHAWKETDSTECSSLYVFQTAFPSTGFMSWCA
ncbi:C-type lectin domain family 2 member H-like [Acomys russatus]|uniref:C-type lectin domain family 2 member H-like n=1 Tax=Acomys russatus TaxID=60746 RepID=UPI0021E21AAC|nr:C-type lectin domain family 2 member H-like [Acomys russatus]